ncbi:MAG: bifunctional adenosylcobinamide kinase/adenosylcobinamide-phosphate guanylyltransferase, partial [Treponema sp.]|nr:bifunctional adenosylcobinamide kinase/adenosylcobinamide-phosphate guanylyltransferase [Treponema sp.]
IRKGTASFLRGPAMSREEAEKALLTGIELSESAKADGVSVLGVGEMGIANTTTSTAVLSVLTGLDPEEITGRGGCITDKMLSHKKEVIKKGIELNKPNKNDVIDVLSKVGGLDLAAMCGVFLGAAKNKLPVVIDGYISVVAALCAARICPLSTKYFFPSHCSEEKGYKIAINELSLAPYLNLRMRLGEGSGCPLAFEIMDAACTIMNDMATFEKAKINDSYLDEVKTESGKRKTERGKLKVESDEKKTVADISAEENSSFHFSTFNFQLVTGGCKNGKSSYAQNLACKIAKKAGSAPIYFATMIPHDCEDEERIQKHRADRKGLGFETIEVGRNLSKVVEKLEAGRVILFDSLTALLANELFEGRRDFSLPRMQEDSEKIVQKIEENIEKLIQKSASVIFVTDEIYCDGKYDEITELYRKNLARIGQFVAKKCEILNAQCGILTENTKGEESPGFFAPLARVSVKAVPEVRAASALIVGGAYQGKRAFAKENFSLSDDDIFVCTADCEPDFSKVCISHYENYVAYCLKNNISPRTDFPDSIIICDDIFCGVVPVDSFQRKLREECGLALQKIASTTSVYRVLCGIAEKIK